MKYTLPVEGCAISAEIRLDVDAALLSPPFRKKTDQHARITSDERRMGRIGCVQPQTDREFLHLKVLQQKTANVGRYR